MSGLATGDAAAFSPAKSPPMAVPLGFILTGLFSLLLLQPLLILKAPMIFADFRFNAATLTAVHLFTLGWSTAVMMGAFYQLAPVILLTEAPPWRPAAVQGVIYVAGSALLISGFYLQRSLLLMVGGSLVVIAVLLFAGLVLATMRSSRAWNITGTYMVMGLGFLVGTVLWGLVLAFNFRFAFFTDTLNHAPVGAHMVLGIGGWFLLTIAGVSYQLIPMFTLSHRSGDQMARAALLLMSSGLWFTFFALVLGLPAPAVGAAVAVALVGVLLWGWELAGIILRRRRSRIDLGMRYALTSLGFAILALLLAVLSFGGLVPLLAESPAPSAVLWLGLVGFVGSMIIGMLYKIVPFLIWHQRFRTKTGRPGPLPTLDEMYTKRIAVTGYWFWTSGILGTGGVLLAGASGLVAFPGAVVPLPLLLCAAGSLLFAWTLVEVMRA